MPRVQPPPLQIAVFDAKGNMTEAWRTYFRDITTAVSPGSAPSTARYLIGEDNSELPNADNLGALLAGYLKISVALGIATPFTVQAIPSSDLSGPLPALDASALLNLNATQLLLGTVPDGRFPATLPAVSGVNLTSLTGANVNHSVVSKVFGDSGYVAAVDQTVLVDATGGATTIKLPAPVSGKFVWVVKTDASVNAVTLDGNGHNIDGVATQSLPTRWLALGVQSDGSNWFIVAAFNVGYVTTLLTAPTGNGLAFWSGSGLNLAESAILISQVARNDADNNFSSTESFQSLVDISAAAAGQIKFPATQNPSSNANTLDDYEEGTWTPADASASALTLTVNAAHYIKIGKLVIASASIVYPATAAGVNNLIGGLPFTVDTATSMWGGMLTATNSSLAALVQALSNTTTMHFTASNGLTYFNSQLSTFAFDFVVVYQATA